MSSPLMTQFLEGIYASRLLDNERIDELLRRPEPPQGDVEGTARFLEGKGWLTRFQIEEIRQGRGQSLTFAGYRLLEKLPELPSGPAYRAFHPALQQAVVVRWIDTEWLPPADNLRSYVERAQAVCLLAHPNAVGTLDAGVAGETPFLVQEYVEGAPLGHLVDEMGALPVTLACEYARQAATVLHTAHERGLFHGDFSPARMILTPILRKPGVNGTGQAVTVRPAPGAIVKVADIGLVPLRPAAGQLTFMQSNLLGDIHFLAPERLNAAGQDAKGDLYSLGASLYFLLAARPPFAAKSSVDALLQLQRDQPARIESLRNDIAAPLADLIHQLLAKNPDERPASAGEVARLLQPFGTSTPAAVPPSEPSYAVPLASETISISNALPALMAKSIPLSSDDDPRHTPKVEPLPEDTSDSQVYSPRGKGLAKREPDPEPEHHDDLFGHHGDATSAPRRVRKEVKGGFTWLVLGACLHLTAVALIVLYFMKIWPFGESTPTSEEPTKEAKKEIEKTPIKKRK